MRPHRILCLVLQLLLLGGCSRSAPSSAASGAGVTPPQPSTARTLDELRERLQTIATDEKIPGAGVALVSAGRVIWAGGVGLADRERGIPVTADTKFRVGSITKSFIALALLQLAEQGRVDLSASVRALAPELDIQNPYEATHPVLLANVLEHTAGFDDMHPSEYVAPRPDLSLFEVLAVNPSSRVVRWQPGTRLAYSNPGYTVAAYILEKKTNRPWEEYVQQAVLLPLEMKEATLVVNPAAEPELARGYEGSPPRPVDYVQILHRPAGNLLASPAELVHLVQLWLQRGRYGDKQIVSAASVARMEVSETLPQSYRTLATQYGLGDYGQFSEGLLVRGHDGGIDGFLSAARYVPDQGIGWVILLNSIAPEGMRKMQKAVIDFLMRERQRPPLPPAVSLPSDVLLSYAGTYRPASPRLQLAAPVESIVGAVTLSVQGGGLRRRTVGGSKTLVPLGSGLFRKDDEPGASRLLTRDAEGHQLLVESGTIYERSSAAWLWLQRGVLVVAFLGSLSGPLFFPIWGLRWAVSQRYRRNRTLGLLPRLVVVLATAALLLFVVGLSRLNSAQTLATVNTTTLLVFLAPLAFVLLSALGLTLTLRGLRQETPGSRAARLHTAYAALSNATLAVYLCLWHLVGLRLWRY